MSRICDMHELCDGKLDTHTVILLVELAIELWDYPISTTNRTVRKNYSCHALVCVDKLRMSRIRNVSSKG